MTYGIKRYGIWKTPYWKEELKINKDIINKNYDEYSDLNEALFRDVLKDELDVPDYAINEKNINKEFGFTNNNREIPKDCIKQIIGYYKWRKTLFDKICKLILNNNAKLLLKSTGCDKLKLRYYIPAEYNNFSTEEPNYTSGQLESYIEISLVK